MNTNEPKNPIDFDPPSARGSIPIPIIRKTGQIHEDFYDYLIVRKYQRSLLGLNKKPARGHALTQKACQIRLFLESLSEDASTNLDYKNVGYNDILAWITEHNAANSPSTFNNYLSNISEFYEFLSAKGVSYKASFPDREERSRHLDSRGDHLLSHTIPGHTYYEELPDHQVTTYVDNYDDHIFSIDQEALLMKHLREIDPVYETIAKVMLQTFLRRMNVCEMYYSVSDDKSRKFMLLPEMIARRTDRQKYKYLSKNMTNRVMPIYIHTWEMIYNEYIRKYYKERLELYNSKFLNRKNGTLYFHRGERKVPNDVLWLNKNGTPIKPNDIGSAFLESGLGIKPHFCRHTGVTRTLDVFCRVNNISPSMALSGRFLQILRELMGHADSKTTERYIHTLENIATNDKFLNQLPDNLDEIEDSMKPFVSCEVLKMIKDRWYESPWIH